MRQPLQHGDCVAIGVAEGLVGGVNGCVNGCANGRECKRALCRTVVHERGTSVACIDGERDHVVEERRVHEAAQRTDGKAAGM